MGKSHCNKLKDTLLMIAAVRSEEVAKPFIEPGTCKRIGCKVVSNRFTPKNIK